VTEIEIRAARPRDVDAIARLCDEMDRFYGDPPESQDRRTRQITGALFADPPSAYAMLAWDGEQLTGLAAYSYLWPAAGTSRSLYLKELYVAESARRTGTGALLMANCSATPPRTAAPAWNGPPTRPTRTRKASIRRSA
jgi:GNAT superfamily N-acetyltransferase